MKHYTGLLVLLLVVITIVSCSKEIEPLSISQIEYNISGERQTIKIDISGDESWTIHSYAEWLNSVDGYSGKGSMSISVQITENPVEARWGILSIKGENTTMQVKIHQEPLFLFGTEHILLKEYNGYKDNIKLYWKKETISFNEGVDATLYEPERQALLAEQEQDKIRDMYYNRVVVDGIELYINDVFSGDYSLYIYEWNEEGINQLGASGYSRIGRETIFNDFKNAWLENCTLATWPTNSSKIRLWFDFYEKPNSTGKLMIIGDSDHENTELSPGFKNLKYESAPERPNVDPYMYDLVYDRFQDRKFYDEEGNEYKLQLTTKTISSIPGIDLSLYLQTILYTYSSTATYPFIQIIKNNQLVEELGLEMYAECIEESNERDKIGYYIEFKSYIAKDNKGLAVRLNCGFNGDFIPHFHLQTNHLSNYQNNSFTEGYYTYINFIKDYKENGKPVIGFSN